MPPYTLDLFADQPPSTAAQEIAPGAILLPRFAEPSDITLITDIQAIGQAAPFRHMLTPGGKQMSVAITNCGPQGWVSDRLGYRYSPHDPQSQQPWPSMPIAFTQLAQSAAQAAGYENFVPDAALINRYAIGARMALHQDRDEVNFQWPIVSVSLGLPAKFLFGGLQRQDKTSRHLLQHGDVVVFGGASRLNFHGIAPISAGAHPLTGAWRYNITFRVTH